MCLPLCLDTLRALSRRRFLAAGASAAAAASSLAQIPAPAATVKEPVRPLRFSRVVDLTHTLTPDFPTWSGQPQLAVETVATLAQSGWNAQRWHVDEHTGTHLDAPLQ